MNQTHVQKVRILYKTIHRLHRGLPPELQILGQNYVKDEFKRHKNCNPSEAQVFMNEWAKYAVGLAEQLGIKGPKYAAPLGQTLDEEALNNLRDDQVAQLYELMLAATQAEVPEGETEVVKVTWPSDLQYFTRCCRDFQLQSTQHIGAPPDQLSKALQRGINPKKLHEISILSSLINEKCKGKNIKSLVDIGSGVGYLDELLVHNYDFNVIGLECDQSKIDGALTRITKQNAKSNVEYKDKLKYICTFISNTNFQSLSSRKDLPENSSAILDNENVDHCDVIERKGEAKTREKLKISDFENDGAQIVKCPSALNSLENIRIVDESIEGKNHVSQSNNDCKADTNKSDPRKNNTCQDLSSLLPSEPYCFIGLHTCGDLSISVIQHFFSFPLAQQLIYIPCCYHKLKTLDVSNETTFANFPLSQALRKVYLGKNFLGVPFLRLAAQETAVAWRSYTKEEKREKVFQLLMRGVLQLYASREKVQLIKKSRRPLKIKHKSAQDTNLLINTCMESFDLQYVLTGHKADWNPTLLSRLWSENGSKAPLVHTLLTLQNCLQCSAESLILLDRLRFLHEYGLTQVELLQIFDERISPRRYCFVVSK